MSFNFDESIPLYKLYSYYNRYLFDNFQEKKPLYLWFNYSLFAILNTLSIHTLATTKLPQYGHFHLILICIVNSVLIEPDNNNQIKLLIF